MAFLVSPGVQVQEKDLTNVIPAVATSIGGTVGEFTWGPANTPITITSENELLQIFGKPAAPSVNAFNNRCFHTAASFLKYGNNLQVVRAVNSTSRNATGGSTFGEPISNRAIFDIKRTELIAAGVIWIGKYPGTLVNGITIIKCTGTDNALIVSAQDDGAPADIYMNDIFSTPLTEENEFHLAIFDTNGTITGTPWALLEVIENLSTVQGAKAVDGSSKYFVDVIADVSKYVYATGATITLEDSGVERDNVDNGVNGTITTGNLETALDFLRDSQVIDVNLLFVPPLSATANTCSTAEIAVSDICQERKDCVGFISAPLSVATKTSDGDRWTEVKAKFVDSGSRPNTSYIVLDSTPLYVYDKYHDVYVWIPACGHMAGLCANTDQVADAWWSPAGFSRGNLRGVTKIAFNPSQAYRDSLYKNSINPIVSFPGQGILLYGDKTAQMKPSAFDRINVRRLFIVLEKAIATAAKYQLFEFNDRFTQAMFRNMVEPYLRDVKGRRGITDFLVVCDASNNTPEVVDSNRFVADIYIKPARSINFITLNFIATRTGVSFSEIAGGAA